MVSAKRLADAASGVPRCSNVGVFAVVTPCVQQHLRGSMRVSAREEGVGRFLSGAFSSLFARGGDAATAAGGAARREDDGADLFAGDGVGGATRRSRIAAASPCADPFMDEEECRLVYDAPDVALDKHRWAHPLFHVEPGCILVANEKLGGVFHQTIVLIIDHNEATGSTGMVINR